MLDLIAQQFTFPAHFGKNFDALYDCMTDPLHKSGPQPGFVIVLEQIPANGKFDKEAREQLASQDKWIKERRAHIADSLASLDKAFDALVASAPKEQAK